MITQVWVSFLYEKHESMSRYPCLAAQGLVSNSSCGPFHRAEGIFMEIAFPIDSLLDEDHDVDFHGRSACGMIT